MKSFLYIIGFLMIFGCNSKEEQTIVEVDQQEKDSQQVTAKDIENLKYTDYVLSPESREAVVNWQRFQELLAQIEFLKKADFSFFNGKNELLVNFLTDLRKDIPQHVSGPAINERLIALETKILKLHSTFNLPNAKKEEVLQNIKEVLVANSNLHLQINKKFEFESQVIEDPSVED